MHTSLISYALRAIKVFVGQKDIGVEEKVLFPLVYSWPVGLAAQPFPKSSLTQTTQEETPRQTFPRISLTASGGCSSSKFQYQLQLFLTSSLTCTCSLPPPWG